MIPLGQCDGTANDLNFGINKKVIQKWQGRQKHCMYIDAKEYNFENDPFK